MNTAMTKNRESRNKINSACFHVHEMDAAMDPDMEMFILIGPCSDLCHIKWVNGWVCLSFVSLLVSFLTILSCRWKSMCNPAMP